LWGVPEVIKILSGCVAIALTFLGWISFADAQQSFKVCRGENIEACGTLPTDAFIGCGDLNAYARNRCPAGVGVGSIKTLSVRDGNRCGYTTVEVTCNQEIAPPSLLKAVGVLTPVFFAILGIGGALWSIKIWSAESSAKARRLFGINDPSTVLRWVAAIGGLLGIIVFGIWAYYQLTQVTSRIKLGLLEFIVPSALAADEKPESVVKLYIAIFVLGMIGAAFIIALIALFKLPDNKANQAKIKAADNIVKMFGGFFTGLATTLLTKF
jgi:hypothetical protein